MRSLSLVDAEGLHDDAWRSVRFDPGSGQPWRRGGI